MYRLIDNQSDFVIISKHHGIDFHRGTATTGLVEKIRSDLQYNELYPVHRLDSMTSGLILFAKNNHTAAELANQFRNHLIDKFYIALGGTHPHKKQGTISGDMKKVRDGRWILCQTMQNPAITQFFSSGMGNGLRLYILKLHTGKTHQIRVAMKSIGVAVLGDPLYSKKTSASVDRGYLHSYSIGFQIQGRHFRYTDIPDTGIHFCSDAFSKTLEKYSDPWTLNWPTLK